MTASDEPPEVVRDDAYYAGLLDALDQRFIGNDPGKVILAAGDAVAVSHTRVNTPWRKIDGERPPHKGARRGKKITAQNFGPKTEVEE